MIEKDFRAVVPLWLAAVAAVALSHAAGRNWVWLGVAAYFLGAPAIGAYVFGHEYTHRTIGMLLTLPTPRSRIWLSKMLLALALVTPLTAIAMYAGPLRGGADARAAEVTLFTLTTLAAMCLASWFTMLARSPLAGTVFTCALAGVLMLLGAWIGVNFYGYTKDVDHFQILFMWATLVPLCAIGVVLGWRAFVELEARDGQDLAIHLEVPRAVTARTTLSRRNPLLLLALKELRLQQLAWALALIYALLYAGLVLWRRGTAEADSLAQALTMFFSGAIAIVIGSVMTAEERQLGTLDMQLLQPLAGGTQWFVKAGVALASAAVMTVVLPLALAAVLPPEGRDPFYSRNGIPPQFVATVMILVASSAYVSSLSFTTMRALTGSIAVVVGIAVAIQRVLMLVFEQGWKVTHTMKGRIVQAPSFLFGSPGELFWWMFAAAVVLLVLRFARVNHQQANRGSGRVAAQVTAVALLAVAGFALAGALGIR
jgi:ABC-type transport system involved in multi-copper enzyme maturation permease subunit